MTVSDFMMGLSRSGVPDAEVIARGIKFARDREQTPVNDVPDRCARMSTRERKAAFAKLVNRDGAKCCMCGVDHRPIWRRMGLHGTLTCTLVSQTSNLEVDHRLALHCGGDNAISNLWLLCRSCHQIKTSREQSERLKRLFAEARP